MTTYVKKAKTAGLFAAVAVLAVFVSGCSKESAVKAPAVEEMDLTQTSDLFQQPLQPNPLALAPEDVVVTVGDEKITHGEIMQGVQMTMMQMSRKVAPQQLSQMAGQIYRNVTDTLIANILLTKAAGNSSLTVGDEDLAKEIAMIESNAPEGSSLKDALAENNISYDEWTADLRKQMLVRKLVEEKTAGVETATIAEAAKFYEENIDSFKVPETVTASHILLAFKPEDTDETKAKKKANLGKIRADILAGDDFAELAGKNSDCPSKQRGGNLGSFERGQMVPEFEQVAFSQEVGGLSEIVETQFGYHLIKVTAHQQAGIRPLAEVSDQLQDYLTGKKKQEALLAYIEDLKSKSDVKFHTPDLDAASRPHAAQ